MSLCAVFPWWRYQPNGCFRFSSGMVVEPNASIEEQAFFAASFSKRLLAVMSLFCFRDCLRNAFCEPLLHILD